MEPAHTVQGTFGQIDTITRMDTDSENLSPERRPGSSSALPCAREFLYVVVPLAALLLGGCPNPNLRVNVPLPNQDSAPQISISAIPFLPAGAPGAVPQIEKQTVTS